MVDYNKRQDVTVEEFKECVETCLPNLHTLHDELQRTLAKVNHLNFKEFFNLKQIYSWFNSL